MKFVPNEEKYWKFILELRNEPKVKKGFINQEKIDEQNHERFMKLFGDKFWICLVDEQPAGFIGEIEGDIRIATFPSFQKRGVGKFLVENLMLLKPECFAKVKIKNKASIKLFESCGFKKKYYILEKE